MSVEPLHTLRFDDIGELVSAAVHPDGLRVFVQIHATSLDAGRLLAEYWPWWLGVIALLLTAAAVVWLVRTVRRRRLIGERYCRNCNYHLAGLRDASRSVGRCPECGVDLSRKHPVIGRKLQWRMAAPAALALVALGGYGLAWVPGQQRTAQTFGVPFASTAAWRWLETQGWSWHREYETQSDVVLEVDLRTGQRTRTVCVRAGATFWLMALTPDGSGMYLAPRSFDGVDLVSTQTGEVLARHRPRLGQFGCAIPGTLVVGHSADGIRVFLNYWDSLGTEALCVDWNTATGQSRVAARVPTYHDRATPHSWGRHIVLSGPPDAPTFISTPTFMEAYTSHTNVLSALDSEGILKAQFDHGEELNQHAEPVVSRSRGLVYIPSHRHQKPTVRCIDTTTCREASQFVLPGPTWFNMSISPDERLLVVPLMAAGPGPGDKLLLRDLTTDLWIGNAVMPAGLFAPRTCVSADNQWLVGVCQGPPRGTGFSFTLVIWQLQRP